MMIIFVLDDMMIRVIVIFVAWTHDPGEADRKLWRISLASAGLKLVSIWRDKTSSLNPSRKIDVDGVMTTVTVRAVRPARTAGQGYRESPARAPRTQPGSGRRPRRGTARFPGQAPAGPAGGPRRPGPGISHRRFLRRRRRPGRGGDSEPWHPSHNSSSSSSWSRPSP